MAMHEDRLSEVEKLLRAAEEELSRLEKHKEFLVAKIASSKREKESLLLRGELIRGDKSVPHIPQPGKAPH